MAAPKTSPVQFENLSPPWSLVTLDTNFTALDSAISKANNYSNYLVDSGTANVYVVTFPGTMTVTLTAGLMVQMRAANSNTGASTLNVNGLGAVAIVNTDGTALTSNNITANGTFTLVYDGTNFQLQNKISAGAVNLLPLNNTWTGTNTYSAGVTLNSTLTSNGTNSFTGANTWSNASSLTIHGAINSDANNAWTGVNTFSLDTYFTNVIHSSGANAWSGVNSFTNNINVTETTAVSSSGVNTQIINITHTDNDVLSGAADFSFALNILQTSNGGKGGRVGIGSTVYVLNPQTGGNHNFVSGYFGGVLYTSDANGALFGLNPAVTSMAGVSMLNLSGMEVDIGAQAGSSVWLKTGIQITALPYDAAQGTAYDAAIMISASAGGTVGWKNGLMFSGSNGANPMSTSGALISTGGSATVGYGLDFRSYSFAADVIAIPNAALISWYNSGSRMSFIYSNATIAGSAPRFIMGNNNWYFQSGAGTNVFQFSDNGTLYVNQITASTAGAVQEYMTVYYNGVARKIALLAV